MKLTQWKRDKDWSDKFLSDIKRILGEHLIREPPQEEDAERNTDLIVLRMEAVRIGCRVRKHEYLRKCGGRYCGEFTIRAGRPSGAKTELTKIIEGWGDYFFYGFANEDESGLAAWLLGNMNVFRLWFNRYLARNGGRVPGEDCVNADKSSSFRAFSICALPKDFIVARLVHEPAPHGIGPGEPKGRPRGATDPPTAAPAKTKEGNGPALTDQDYRDLYERFPVSKGNP